MRYTLRQDDKFIAESNDVMDLINGAWPAIRDNQGSGFVVYDHKVGVRWHRWACYWSHHYNGVELNPLP